MRPSSGKTSEERKAAARDHYWRNRDAVLARVKDEREKVKEYVAELRKQPCADCGGQFPPACMQLHHVDPSTKKMEVPNAGHLTTAKKEAAKCVVICANCHCIRHAQVR